MQQGFISLRNLDLFVLDEADRMLDMGFIHDVKKVISQLPQNRQTLFFSATMPPEIAGLADSILKNPVKVAVTPVSSTAEKIEQALYFVEKANKKLLLHHLLQDTTITSALVFSRTKHGANKIASDVNKAGIRAEAIHGNKSQNARQAALSGFKSGKLRVLVATDIAARGIDIDNLSHVINFDLPNIPETYVHRIGRTGRAGASGIAISFCDKEELPYLKDIEKLTGLRIPVMETHPFPTDLSAPPYLKQESQKFNAIIPSTLKGKQQPSAEVRQKPDRHSSKASLPPSYHQRKNEARNIGREENRDQALNRNANKNEDFNNNKRQNNNIIKQNNTIKQENNFQVPERKNRFASILEVAQLEKQPAFNKPKPTYKDRTGNNPANKENRGENAKDSNTRDRNRPRKYSK
jgi:superfamily II DNA/RNA helicase